MLLEGRLTRYFQSIVRVDAPEEVYAQESLLRALSEDGDVISLGPTFEAASDNDMLFQVDLTVRASAVREAVRHGIEHNLFINFTRTSVYDPKFRLRSTVQSERDAQACPTR